MATRSSLPESCKYWPPSTGRRWRFWKSKAVCLRKNNYLRFKPHCDTETLLRGLTLQRGQFFLYFVGIRSIGRIRQVGLQLLGRVMQITFRSVNLRQQQVRLWQMMEVVGVDAVLRVSLRRRQLIQVKLRHRAVKMPVHALQCIKFQRVIR